MFKEKSNILMGSIAFGGYIILHKESGHLLIRHTVYNYDKISFI
jgi:hypothetical protein